MAGRPRVVFVLGAGASAAVSETPIVTANLLGEILEHRSKYPPGEIAGAAAFVEFLSGASRDRPAVAPRIDEILSLVDFAIDRRAPLGPDWPVDRMRTLRTSLVALIFECVQQKIDRRPTRSDALTQLVRAVVDRGRQAAVVTLNWDCLVEEAVFDRRTRHLPAIDYGIECSDVHGAPIEPLPDATLVLKPHGSLSWNYCGVCSSVVVFLPRTSVMPRPESCPTCGSAAPLEPVVVPPTTLDWTEPPFLERVWTAVEQVLAGCEHAIFIGYSLPDQDLDVRFHLLRARARRTEPPLVTVVSRTPAGSDAKADLGHRYESLLAGHACVEHLEYADGLAGWIPARLGTALGEPEGAL